MNISPQNISGTCKEKCNFSFNYANNSYTATNYGQYIMLSNSDLSATPVVFNNNKYIQSAFRLINSSMQKYNGKNADAELVIYHYSSTTGAYLGVIIPLSTNGISGTASNNISQIINAVSTGAPSQGGSTSQGIPEINLNDFIPMKEFYNYNTNGSDIVAFGIKNAIYISQNDLTTLQKITKPTTEQIPTGPLLYVNSKGPSRGNSADSSDIYIDCQPTDSSEEETTSISIKKPQVNFDIGNFFNSPIFIFMLLPFIFVIIIMLIHKFLTYLSGGETIDMHSAIAKGLKPFKK
jgi:carbonic anhydrase|uniref:Alpha-carbonic anhydrase domain-containing protein n=1 Tax=viral metagenome TaxID=1070528 RepID=A0A6C0D8S0_9ZZZZ